MNRSDNKRWRAISAGTVLAAMVALLLMVNARAYAQGMAASDKPEEKTLYERLGGYDAISAVVEDFLGRLKNDHMFDRFGPGRGADSHQRTKQLIKDQICAYTGGPCAYIGRDMAAAHQGLGITQKEWDASVQHLKESLDHFKVADKEQKELLALVDKLKTDIIEKPKKEEGADKKEEKKEEKPPAQN